MMTETFLNFADSNKFLGDSVKNIWSTVGKNGKWLIEYSSTLDWNSTISTDGFFRRQFKLDSGLLELKSQPKFFDNFSEIVKFTFSLALTYLRRPGLCDVYGFAWKLTMTKLKLNKNICVSNFWLAKTQQIETKKQPDRIRLCSLVRNPHLGVAPAEWMIALWKRFFEIGDIRWRATLSAPEPCPIKVIWLGSPPKNSMLDFTHCNAML